MASLLPIQHAPGVIEYRVQSKPSTFGQWLFYLLSNNHKTKVSVRSGSFLVSALLFIILRLGNKESSYLVISNTNTLTLLIIFFAALIFSLSPLVIYGACPAGFYLSLHQFALRIFVGFSEFRGAIADQTRLLWSYPLHLLQFHPGFLYKGHRYQRGPIWLAV